MRMRGNIQEHTRRGKPGSEPYVVYEVRYEVSMITLMGSEAFPVQGVAGLC
jgi:hypothetical protein